MSLADDASPYEFRAPQPPGETIGHGRRTIIETVALVLSTIAGFGLLPLVLLTAFDVARRELTGKSVLGAVEMIEVGMVCVVFLAMMGAQVNERHIRTPLVTNRLPAVPANAVRLLGCLMSVAFLAWLTYQTGAIALESIDEREYRFGIVRVAVWPARLCIPIGLGGLGLHLLLESWQLGRRLINREGATFHQVESNL